MRFEKDLEIVLVMSERNCVDRIIKLLKQKMVQSEVFWIKSIEQAEDFIDSKGAYEGKIKSDNEKLFVVDPRLGHNDCLTLSNIFNNSEVSLISHFYLLANHLNSEEKGFFTNFNIGLIEENFEIEIGEAKLSSDKSLMYY